MNSKKKRRSTANPGKGPVPRLPAIEFEDFAESDRYFRARWAAPEFFVDGLRELGDKDDEHPQDPVAGSSDSNSKSGKNAKGGKNSKRGRSEPEHRIDLHGLTLQQAIERLERTINVVLAVATQQITMRVITGKGLHSGPGGGILAREIHRYVRERYGPRIAKIEASPAESVLGGVPMRGHFLVTFQPQLAKNK